MKLVLKWYILQSLKLPLIAGSRKNSVPNEFHVKGGFDNLRPPYFIMTPGTIE